MSSRRGKSSNAESVKSNKTEPVENVKPEPPAGMPKKEEEWDKFFATLDPNEPDEPPGSSMISHMMKSMKPGVDLSKTPLPSWFLQKRSILECYSDFFVHPEEFAAIADKPTAETRMVQCFRFFLLGFNAHFHKLAEIAKKPFNSILGETFEAEIPITPGKLSKPGTTSMDTLWPWAEKGNLVYYGEQVSHHPPVSAFYVEYPPSKIEAVASLHADAKFRGLYVKVRNLGGLAIRLLSLGEDYFIKFPNGYGRSLMTTPWVEAGGKGAIICPKTGFTTEIEFVTKSMFGSEKAKIKAKITGPNNYESNFEGNWNGKVFRKNGKILAKDAWLDVEQFKPKRLKTRPMAQQEKHESRKVWREVSWCIKNKDNDNANKFKLYVENTERALRKEREAANVEWKQRKFTFNQKAGIWKYHTPLSTRLKQRNKETVLDVAAQDSLVAPLHMMRSAETM